MTRRVIFKDYLDEKLKDAQEIEMANGEVFRIPPPELWPDSIYEVQGDAVGEAKAILGEEEYTKFVAAGGNARALTSIIREGAGASVPE